MGLHPPAIREVYIEAAGDSLDIRSLSELTTAFDLPVDRWPTVEFELAVDASPLRARPGEVVTFRIQVRNAGKRDVNRAEIHFGVETFEGERRDYRWFPAIPAGRTVAVEHAIRLPEGRGILHASVLQNAPNAKRFYDTNRSNNSAALWVHQVADPPELPARVPR